MPLDFYQRKTQNIQESNQIVMQPKATDRKINEAGKFLKDLIIFEKGQITNIDQAFDTFMDKKIIPHKDMPWDLYKESYRRIPLVYNAINNTADFAIQAGFEIEATEFSRGKIESWADKVNFELLLANIIKQMQIYGNAYLDISDINFPKLLPPETMFVQVVKGGDNDGQIIGYVQKNSLDPKKNVEFNLNELVHFKWNDAVNNFYGLSEIHPALGAITRYENLMLDLGNIMHYFAAPTIHWKVGTDEVPGTQTQIDSFTGLLNVRLVGQDIVTSSAISHEVIGAGQSMMQLDGLIIVMQNEILSALRMPATFARGGESSNKATAQVELEAFDRKVKAIQQAVKDMVEDFLFPKLTNGKVYLKWNDVSAEGELMRAQRLNSLVISGIPLEIAMDIVGMGTWADDVVKAKKEQEQKALEQQQQNPTQMDAKNSKKDPVGKQIS